MTAWRCILVQLLCIFLIRRHDHSMVKAMAPQTDSVSKRHSPTEPWGSVLLSMPKPTWLGAICGYGCWCLWFSEKRRRAHASLLSVALLRSVLLFFVLCSLRCVFTFLLFLFLGFVFVLVLHSLFRFLAFCFCLLVLVFVLLCLLLFLLPLCVGFAFLLFCFCIVCFCCSFLLFYFAMFCLALAFPYSFCFDLSFLGIVLSISVSRFSCSQFIASHRCI